MYPVESSMAKNKYYQAIFKSMASILSVFLPLTLLMIFNCLLATSVYKAHIMRHNLATLSVGTERPNRVSLINIKVFFINFHELRMNIIAQHHTCLGSFTLILCFRK